MKQINNTKVEDMSRLRAALTNATTFRTKLCRAVVKGAAGLAFLAVVGGQAQADTLVSGYVIAETWTATGSPYRLVGDVFVLGLTIESNVTVQADGNYEFEVAGQLQVKGTAAAPVRFTPSTTNGWKGILFRDAVPGSFFTYTTIEGSKNSAIRITNTPPALTNCIIRNNRSPLHGGGILAVVTGNPLVLQGCIVSNNMAGPYGSGSIYGGGMCVFGAMVLSETLIVSNWTQGSSGFGGGLFIDGVCIMRKTQVVKNVPNGTSRQYADGIYFQAGMLDMANCVVSSNGISGTSGYGGGLWAYNGTAKVRNCIFSNNGHEGTRQEYGSLALVNCTISANAHLGVNGSGATTVTNCIVYFNYNGGQQIGGASSIAYSDVQGGVQPGPGNISYSPALCPQNQSLIQGSPCIDAGNPAAVFDDVCIDATLCAAYSRGTLRNDMGAYGGPGACNWLAGNAPAIVTQPQSQTSCLGQTATFSVGASGSDPLSYQWFFKNVAMPGRTGSLLTLTGLQSTNAGTYAVVVSNVFGSVTSAPAQLVVNDACVDICTYAGLNIAGLPGRIYELRYTTDLNNTNFATWTFLATNTTPWFYIDTTSCGVPKRFYGVKLRP